MTGKKRVFALLLAAAFAFAVFSSCLVTVVGADHDCSGADCEICLVVSACVNFLRGTLSCAAVFALALAVCFGAVKTAGYVRIFRAGRTPVILRVKLSN